MTITLADIQVDGDKYKQSLLKLIGGKRVADIVGYLTSELGGVSFKLTQIVFEDGTGLGVEGEHDHPYVTVWRTQPQPNMDEETLDWLYAAWIDSSQDT